jgi:hypothetical protein
MRSISRTNSLSSANVPDKSADLIIVEQLAQWLDTKFVVPGTGIRFGLDAILGLLPGLGDALTSVLSLYILSIANRHNVSRVTQTRMAANIAVDWLVGSIPLIGDVFDVTWKANARNAALLKLHLLATTSEQRKQKQRDWLFLCFLIVILLAVLATALIAAYFMVRWVWLAFTS